MESSPSELALDVSRLVAICEEEWSSFLADLQVHPIPERQDRRAFLLNWAAVFTPEIFQYCSLKARMANWMEAYLSEDDETLSRWLRAPLIGAVLFALTKERYWLRVQRRYFDYGGADVRSFFHDTLGLVAPDMAFDHDLRDRLDYGMKVPYFYMDTPLALFAVSEGNAEEKIPYLKKWKAEYFMNSAEEQMVDAFLNGGYARNPLQTWMLRNTSYVLLRLGCFATSRIGGDVLPLGLSFSDVRTRMLEHPLMAGVIQVRSA